ncbi:MAG: glutathione S-transferase family protein [Sphingobium sp.]|uniref:glutathione S-transferase family protein n=1 Tax=Sphingobium sp. TaxID=1912891 RepID=UPI0029A1C709|nr:glutathione S-transferase family protein [Sphingobium sp.]MDX3909140.1 glutathione S-transferase family protein [Sphingobium sp.]
MASLELFAHPFSSYCQKAIIAFYEHDIPFTMRTISPDEPENGEELARLWPIKRFPVLKDGDHVLCEASIIIEHLDIHDRGSLRLVPEHRVAALRVRMMDRFFDNYVSTPQQKIVLDALRPDHEKDPAGVRDARATLDTSYAWLDKAMEDREWAAADHFTMADCGAAPFLFYAHWVHLIAPQFANVLAYRARLLARPSFARAVDEARHFRSFFPLPVPDED